MRRRGRRQSRTKRRYGYMAPRYYPGGEFKFDFVSADCNEPMHFHVTHATGTVKIWLEPEIEEASRDKGVSDAVVRRALRAVRAHYPELVRTWEDHCGKRK